ncbi:MAG: hypothetical protein HC872_01700 [Gammaproteobacteria bacterium]|nr:hypothetical protein [Gammaproteobacteria bacterium]
MSVFRFLVLSWNAADPECSARARQIAVTLSHRLPEFRGVLRIPGLQVLIAGEERGTNSVHRLHGSSGVVLGVLFARHGSSSSACKASLNRTASEAIVNSGGAALVERYWGRYVAFLADATGTRWVVRDPSGSLPCLLAQSNGIGIHFSWIEDYCALAGSIPSLDWKFIAAHALARLVDTRETGLQGISEILPGEALRLRQSTSSRHMIYRPALHATQGIIEDPVAATAAIRDAVRSCVGAWASLYPRLVHRLSGGLDSSIVLACLRMSRDAGLFCVNYRGTGFEGDERFFAGRMAAQVRCPLQEIDRTTQVALDEIPAFALSPRPAPSLIGYDSILTAHGRRTRSRRRLLVFGGVGGDQVFFQNPAVLTIADRMRRAPLAGGMFKAVLDAACMQGYSIWWVLRKAMRACSDHPWTVADVAGNRQLLRTAVVDDLMSERRFVHPWLSDPAANDLPPGKLWQLFALSTPLPYYDYVRSHCTPERVEPLLSQPVVEACLRIPSYRLLAGGRDRALARRAFANELPREIAVRRSKGGFEQYVHAVLRRNLPYVRAQLLDGMLVSHGIVDGEKLRCASGMRQHASP